MSSMVKTERRRELGSAPSSTRRVKRGGSGQSADLDVDCVYDRSFSSPGAERKLWGARRECIPVPHYRLLPEISTDVGQDFVARRILLTGEQERTLFLRYNYAKYRLRELLKLQRKFYSSKRAERIATWHNRAQAVRAKLTNANLPLVPSMAKRVRVIGVEYSELISEGYMAVLRSVEKFDVARGFKFSTYACRSILKCFHRLAAKHRRFRKLFPVEFDPELEKSDYGERRHRMQRSDSIDAVREVLNHNCANLSNVERSVILERFSILSRGRPQTLSQVGQVVGLTNERVRQIEKKSLRKIRAAYEAYFTAPPTYLET